MSFTITGTGSYLPGKVVTNDDLTAFLDTSDEWISTRTGIRARHVAAQETVTDMGGGCRPVPLWRTAAAHRNRWI